MKTKILVVDPLSHPEHVMFNNIYLGVLSNCNYDIETLSCRGILEGPKDFKPSRVHLIPEDKKKIKTRLGYYRRQFTIMRRCRDMISENSYEIVFFLSYDTLSVFFMLHNVNMILVNHNNISRLNFVKEYALRLLSRRSKFVVFRDNIREMLEKKGFINISVVQHGLPEVSHDIQRTRLKIKQNIRGEKVIFVPSGSTENDWFESILLEKSLLLWLRKNNFRIVVKSEDLICQEIITSKPYFEKMEYDWYMQNCFMIILPLPEHFEFRVSGVLHEAFAYDKPVAVSNINSVEGYKDMFNYNPLATSGIDLIRVIEDLNRIYKNDTAFYEGLSQLSNIDLNHLL